MKTTNLIPKIRNVTVPDLRRSAKASNTAEQFNFMCCAFKKISLLIFDEPSNFPYSESQIKIESTLNVDIPAFP